MSPRAQTDFVTQKEPRSFANSDLSDARKDFMISTNYSREPDTAFSLRAVVKKRPWMAILKTSLTKFKISIV